MFHGYATISPATTATLTWIEFDLIHRYYKATTGRDSLSNVQSIVNTAINTLTETQRTDAFKTLNQGRPEPECHYVFTPFLEQLVDQGLLVAK